jgi:hypothetical protein
MPRMTRSERTELKRRLGAWQSPEAMLNLANEAGDRIGSRYLFNQSGLSFLTDALTAAEFGQIRQAEKARLVDDDWSDFELAIGERIERFEAVEADDPDRKRGDEYKDDTAEIRVEARSLPETADLIPTWLAIACQKKADKHYGARANLVIYLNASDYGIRQKEIEQTLPVATAAVKDCFDAVWVYWKRKAYLVWQGGKACRAAP